MIECLAVFVDYSTVLKNNGGNDMQTINGIKDAVTPIAKDYGLRKVYLFGSYAKGNATEESDVDLLIEIGRKMTLLGLSGLRQDVSQSLELPVDIVTMKSLDDDFRDSIRGSEVLYEE